MASQSDEDTSSLPSFSAAFPSLRSCGSDKGLRCCVCKQSAGIQELKVRFPMCDGGADFQMCVSVVGKKSVDIQYEKQQNNQ